MSQLKENLLVKYQSTPYETHQLFLKSFERIPFDPLTLETDTTDKVVYALNGREFEASRDRASKSSDNEEKVEGATTYDDRYALLNFYMVNDIRRLPLGNSAETNRTNLTRTYASPDQGRASYYRHIITLNSSSNYTIIDRVTGAGERSFLSDNNDYVLGDSAELLYIRIVDGNRSAFSFNDNFYVGRSSRLKIVELVSNIGFYRGKMRADLVGDGGDVKIYSGFSTGSTDKIDHTVMVKNDAKQTTGHAFQRAIVNGASRVLLKGLMKISDKAINSDSFLDQHSLLLARSSFSLAIPGLEIDNNELKAKHSASVSQLDQDQLFYLMTRGLDRTQAMELVSQGFLTPIVREMPKELMDEMIKEGKVYGISP